MSNHLPCKEFVARCRKEKDSLLSAYFDENGQTAVSTLLASLNLSAADSAKVRESIDIAVTDTFFTILYALNGSANLGGDQQIYTVFDEDGKKVSADDSGDLESYCSEFFG